MNTSVLDMFTIGLGPSSSHTVGPMRAAAAFAASLKDQPVARIQCCLHGSLADTGTGHGTDRAMMLGLAGCTPESVEIDSIPAIVDTIRNTSTLRLSDSRMISFHADHDIRYIRNKPLPRHPNGMRFIALDQSGLRLCDDVFYSTGGGFIVRESEWDHPQSAGTVCVPYPFNSAQELLEHCAGQDASISDIIMANETMFRSESETRTRLDAIWAAMQACIARGIAASGVLPGGLGVIRRARSYYESTVARAHQDPYDPLIILDWVNVYALAVNEENAAGSRVVTAPTNGAAGILPSVLTYATRFRYTPYSDGVHRFLLTAGAIGSLYKSNASISGADVGCQGEVGVACSMAAGALAEYVGGTPQQVECAAEIGMEHNLGLTCDPIGGLVQIPCIERNAMASVKAINASRLAIKSQSSLHFVSLDKVIKTMLATGKDMRKKYKETSRGGLAVNVVEC